MPPKPEYFRTQDERRRHGKVRVRMEKQGQVIRVRVDRGSARSAKCGSSKRGVVKGMSRKSRVRMLELVGRLQYDGRVIFMTLTYGRQPPGPDVAKGHLRAFCKRLARRDGCDELSYFWKLESQEKRARERGVGYIPHFHLILFNCPFIPSQLVASIWGGAIGSEHWDHTTSPPRHPFTRIEAVNSTKGVMHYVAKYVAKADDIVDTFLDAPLGEAEGREVGLSISHTGPPLSQNVTTGRCWGVGNFAKLPFAALTTTDRIVSRAMFYDWVRFLGDWLDKTGRSCYREQNNAGRREDKGFMVLSEAVDQFWRFLDLYESEKDSNILGPED